MRRRVLAVAAAGIGMLLLSACGVPGPPQERSVGTPVDAITCVDDFAVYEGADPGPASGVMPDDFAPVAVIRCEPNATRELDGGVVWSGMLLERFEGDLGPFLGAIAAPSDPQWPGPCTANMVLAPDLWVEGADGRFVRLSYPSTGCSQPKVEVVAAPLAALRVVDEEFTPRAVIKSPEAEVAGCATRASVGPVLATEVDFGQTGEEASAQPESADGQIALIPEELPTLPSAADVQGLRVCVYAAQPGVAVETDGALFMDDRRIDPPDVATALAAVASAAPVAGCTETASRFAVVQPLPATAASFTVEFDGCRRVIDPAFRALAAPPPLLALLDSTP
ncbi:hypothetical protein [Microbacterium sp. P04]|uniref:hypothetical protein n=1 Tax=Microbacterium sp. P04 TaxID=3366947 RepID=UPI003744B443